MKLVAGRLHLLIWALIYGGLLVGAVGIALQRAGAGYGWAIVACSALAVIVGVVLVWVRSRLPEP